MYIKPFILLNRLNLHAWQDKFLLVILFSKLLSFFLAHEGLMNV